MWSRRPNTHRDGTQHKLRKSPPPALMSAGTERIGKKKKGWGVGEGFWRWFRRTHLEAHIQIQMPITKVTITAHAHQLTCQLTPTSMCTHRHECITSTIIHHAEPLPRATAHSQASSSTSLGFSPSPPRPSHLLQIGCFTLHRRAFFAHIPSDLE